ncbi:MAG: alanine racemase, partial [Clostridia bacterium]
MGKFVNVVVSQENLRFNLEKIKLYSKNKKICVMVKANSYGHGIKEVVSALKGRADFFGVINLEEAFKVRCEDSFTPIICFAPIEEHDFLFASKMNVSLSISSLQYFFNILKFVNKTACKIKIHININTGMNRLGIKTVKQFKEMQDECENNKNIIVEGVYTHFAAAECDAKFSERQIKTFNKFLFHLSKRFSGIIHVGGSAAMMLKYDNLIEDIDMFRVGINIYGYN